MSVPKIKAERDSGWIRNVLLHSPRSVNKIRVGAQLLPYEYPGETMSVLPGLYEGRIIKFGHWNQGGEKAVGKSFNAYLHTNGKIYGDAKLVKSHPMFDTVMEAAEDPEFNDLLTLSHEMKRDDYSVRRSPSNRNVAEIVAPKRVRAFSIEIGNQGGVNGGLSEEQLIEGLSEAVTELFNEEHVMPVDQKINTPSDFRMTHPTVAQAFQLEVERGIAEDCGCGGNAGAKDVASKIADLEKQNADLVAERDDLSKKLEAIENRKAIQESLREGGLDDEIIYSKGIQEALDDLSEVPVEAATKAMNAILDTIGKTKQKRNSAGFSIDVPEILRGNTVQESTEFDDEFEDDLSESNQQMPANGFGYRPRNRRQRYFSNS